MKSIMRRNCGNDQDHQECSLLEEIHGERMLAANCYACCIAFDFFSFSLNLKRFRPSMSGTPGKGNLKLGERYFKTIT